MTKGRAVPPLPTVTLPVCGAEVRIHPLGRFMMDEIGKAATKAAPPKPEPPLNEVTGLDGQPTQEPNEADPEYQAALSAHNDHLTADIVMRMMRIGQQLAVECEPEPKVVARIRKGMQAGGIELEGDDAEVYFWHHLVREDDDFKAMLGAITRQSQVTEEAVSEVQAGFPDQVPGA